LASDASFGLAWLELAVFPCHRSTKRDASALDAFDSPNYPALAHVEIDYDIAWEKMLPTPVGDFTIDTRFEQNVSVLTLFPGMKPEVVESQLRPPMKGVVLRAFGAGNAPDNNKPFLEVLRKASERGVVIVAVTQCFSTSGFLLSQCFATDARSVVCRVVMCRGCCSYALCDRSRVT
jgi:L-asparaginase/Glu-tRNA(Gln) amidotransferase subunit D